MKMLPMFLLMFGLIGIEIPIAFALIASALAWLHFASPVPMSIVVQLRLGALASLGAATGGQVLKQRAMSPPPQTEMR